MRLPVLIVVSALITLGTPAAAAAAVHGDGTSVHRTAARTAAARSACNDTAYTFLGPGASWQRKLAWSFRASSMSLLPNA